MTLPNLTSPTAELEAYRDELVNDLSTRNKEIARLTAQSHHVYRLIEEVLDLINRRESCPHPSLTDGTCSGCGLPADQLPFMTTTHWRECPHEDFTENLEGRKCRECGLDTK